VLIDKRTEPGEPAGRGAAHRHARWSHRNPAHNRRVQEPKDIERHDAVLLFKDAVSAAKQAGFPWNEQPIQLVPQQRLIELVAMSRAQALIGEREGEAE
jgi:hypothetical protein